MLKNDPFSSEMWRSRKSSKLPKPALSEAERAPSSKEAPHTKNQIRIRLPRHSIVAEAATLITHSSFVIRHSSFLA
jgi:hypothetical protein